MRRCARRSKLFSPKRRLHDRKTLCQDVLATLGVKASAGQIRVTKTTGSGKMWGLTAAVYDDGRVTVAVGKHP